MAQRNFNGGSSRMKVYGRLEPFFETGTEGIVWSVQDPWLPSYDGLWCLREGDHLRVLGKWEGIIDFDYERDVVESSGGGRGQAVHGFWVNGLQRDVGSEQWVGKVFAIARGGGGCSMS